MEIKSKTRESKLTEIILQSRYIMISSKARIILCLMITTIVAFVAGSLMYRSGSLVEPYRFVRSIMTLSSYRYGLNYMHGRLARPERIYIDIQYEDFQRLAYWRSLALEKRTLYGVDHDYVNAQVRYKEDTRRTRIRLKGGGAEAHLGGDKWSLRVEMRGDGTLFGMKEFSLMDPQRRNFMLEWLLRRVLKKEGVISKRYRFIEVIINGENKGIYAMDEHYGKTMIEANRRREGPIIRLTQDDLWFDKASWYLAPPQRDDYYFSADVDAIGSKQIISNEVEYKEFENALNLFEAFRNGHLTTHEIFDVGTLAKWMAICDVMGAWHGFGAANMKFYYNPITSKLEPVSDDAFNETTTDPGDRIFRLYDQYNKGRLLKQLFSDPIFTEKYIQELERVVRKSYLDNILDELTGEITENLYILYKDYPMYEFPKGQLYKNQERLNEILNPRRGIIAYFEGAHANTILLNIASVKTIPMEILNATYKENTALTLKHGRTILRGKDYAKPLVYNRVEFVFPEEFPGIESPSELKVNYRLLGTSRSRSEAVFPWHSFDQNFLTNDFITQQPNFQDFPFVTFDVSSNQISIEQGHWTMNKSLIIPKGHTFVVTAGTILDLTNGATILSYSPIRFIGSDGDPIIIKSSDSTGQGVAVLNANGESFVENVIFENLSEPAKNSWQLVAAITFYESPVNIQKSRFIGNRSEDALNIIRSSFTIGSSLFTNSASDALDIDFGEGFIRNTVFINSGNDAMDFSGSVVHVSRCYVNGVGDKGISAGENSQITAKHIEIRNGTIGVVSKDMSNTRIEDITIYNTRIGLATYQKKREFGPATLFASKVTFVNVPRMYLIEERSILVLNGKNIHGSEVDVAQGIYKE